MATELWCTKIVHNNVEHQYWIDRTVSMSDMFKKNCPADWHPVEYKNMTSRRMWHSIWYKSGNKVGKKLLFPKINVDWDGMIYYNPNSRILEWGGWSIHGLRDTNITQFYNNLSGKSKLNNMFNNRSKTHLQNILRNFTNQGNGKSEMLKHFDKHSYWYWDSYSGPFTEKQIFGTYNLSSQDIITYV